MTIALQSRTDTRTGLNAYLKRRVLLILATFSFSAALAMSYSWDIALNWRYYGFGYVISTPRLIFSLLTVFFFAVFTRAGNGAAAFYQILSIFILLCPAAVYYSFGGATDTYFGTIILGLFAMFLTSHLSFKRPTFSRLSKRSVLALMLSLTVFSILAMVALGGLRYFNLNLLDVYLFRRSAAELLPSIFGYIISPVAKVVIPLGIVLGVYYRSNAIAVLFVLLTVVFFGLTHHKSVIAAPIVVLIFYLGLQRFSVQKSLIIVFLGIAAICLFEVAWRRAIGVSSSGMLSTFVMRRGFFMPALVDNLHIQFFTENSVYYWSNSRVSFGLVSSPYEVSSPFLIGEAFFGQREMSANTGFLGSGYANARSLGVVVYGLVLGFFIAVLNAHGRAVGHPFVICASLVVITSAMMSSDLVTILITHGLIFLMLCLSIMPGRSLKEAGA
ncbi:MAG: hypothetical protein AAFN63_01320 [Pseudomonadota bacterium]